MRRSMRRSLRNFESAELVPMPENYISKHGKITDVIEGILAELCEALNVTDEFIAEITAPARKRAERAERMIKSIKLRVNVPEVCRKISLIPDFRMPEYLRNPVPICGACYAGRMVG